MSKTVTIAIDGMTCQGCIKSVTRALLAVPGVSQADVSLDQSRAQIIYDESLTGPESLTGAIAEAGFEPRL